MDRKTPKGNNSQIIILYDENLEGLAIEDVWINKKEIKITSVKKEGWSGMSDFEIARKLDRSEKKKLFITADKEKKKKDKKDFLPKQTLGIIKLGNNTTSVSNKEQLLEDLQLEYKDPENLVGREIKVTQNQIIWKTYKDPTTTHIKKLKRT